MNSKYLFLFFLSLFFAKSVDAQPPMVFRNYTINDGLSHNFVRQVLEGSEGFIWIATIEGLNKFDGYSFKAYKAKHHDSTSLSSNNVITICEDKNGNLWIGTWGGGISVYNKKSGIFNRIPQVKDPLDSTGIFSEFISVLYTDTNGRVWIGTADKGLVMADPDRLTFTHYMHDAGDITSLSHNVVSAIVEDDKGKLWIGTGGGGLNYFDPETEEFLRIQHRRNEETRLSDNNVLAMCYDSRNRLWVATNDETLNVMDTNTGKFTYFKNNPDDPKSLCDSKISKILETSGGEIWIGTDVGLLLYNEKSRDFYHYHKKNFDPKSLSSNQIKSVYEDSNGSLWIGTYNGGVNLFDKSFINITHYYNTFDPTSLSFNDVSAFMQDADSNIWVGTDGGGLNIFDKKDGEFINFKHDPKDDSSIASNLVKSMLLDRKNRLWIGLWGGGLEYFEPDNQSFIPPEKGTEWDNSWTGKENVTCLAEDADGYIWASTWGNGVYRFDPDFKSFKNFTEDERSPHSVSENNAWAIYADRSNNVWVGNIDGVLDLYDRKNERFIHFDTKQPGESGAGILTIFEDSKDRLWIGLEGGGLKMFNKEKGTFTSFRIENGLPSNYINSIEEDHEGNLWLGTNNGIARFYPETGKVKSYGLSHGLQSLQFNRQASIQLGSGELMFGGVNGFNTFYPDSLIEKTKDIPIVFSDFQIFNKPVIIGGKDSPLQAHINETRSITLPYNQSVFSLEYAGLNFADPENVRYKYRLKGFLDQEWQEVGKERKVTYTNLDPGSYVFEVAATYYNYEGSPRALSITITPPWWQTWWARIAMILGSVSALILFYRERVNGIKRHNKQLEKEVSERTSSLKNVNEELILSQRKLTIAYDQVKLKTEALNQIAIIIESNAIGQITDVNQMFLDTLGYAKDEIIGKTYFDLQQVLFCDEMRSSDFFRIITTDVLPMGETWRGEVCCVSKSGEPIWLSKNMIPSYDKGEFKGYFSFSYNISMTKKREEEIVEARRIAEEASETKETFLSVMSHEIRTPLNSVIGLSNLLLNRAPREDQLEIVRTLKNSGDNLMYLVNNILDFNKLRAGKIEAEHVTFSLNEQLNQLQFSYQPIASEKDIDFQIVIASDIPSQLIGDSMRLRQILDNLLNNAFKFTLNGGIKLSIYVPFSDNENCILQFVVQDTGIGISKEKLKSVFVPFHQSEKYISRKFGGTGLGLSIVKDLVFLLNGSISVSSEVNKGTTFKVKLPFKIGNESMTLSQNAQEAMALQNNSLEGYRILYVEDVESNQMLLKNLFGDKKAECVVASSGEVALLHTKTKSFDAILMDIQMPGMTGYEAATAIRNQEGGRNQRTPILAFTADSYSENLKLQALQAGMQDLMTKPFQFEHLLEKIVTLSPHKKSEEEFLSFQFYEWTFNYDAKRLNNFKDLLIKDFRDFEAKFNIGMRDKDLYQMHLAIHRMSPIVKNLKCRSIMEIFAELREIETYNSQVEQLARELGLQLQIFFATLEKLHY